jgi:hypothetical protein
MPQDTAPGDTIMTSEQNVTVAPVAEVPAAGGSASLARRCALVLIAGLAGLSYAWALNTGPLEPYYAAAVRSMSMSWHNFIYGAFDPAGTITLDKLPGAFWVQAPAGPWPSSRPTSARANSTWCWPRPRPTRGCGGSPRTA